MLSETTSKAVYKPDKTLLINSASHFFVDAVCICTLFSVISSSEAFSLCILLYNTAAFSTQCAVGFLLDTIIGKNLERSKGIRQIGLIQAMAMLLIAVFALLPLGAITQALLIGLFNSVFHVCGGMVTLKTSEKKAAPLGVFVAPGAFGVTLGKMFSAAHLLFAGGLIICAFLCALNYIAYKKETHIEPVRLKASLNEGLPIWSAEASGISRRVIAAVILLTAAVAVRAIGGIVVSFDWKSAAWHGIIITLFVFLGKALGGYACDAFGAGRMSIFTVSLAAVLIAFLSGNMAASLVGQLMLNLSMPVTLFLMFKLLPDAPGLAFGLTASALWPGTIAGKFINLSVSMKSALIILCFMFSLGAIIYAERVLKRSFKTEVLYEKN